MKTETITVTTLSYHEFDDLCQEHLPVVISPGGYQQEYPWRYESIADNSWSNYEDHTLTVNLSDPDTIEELEGDRAEAVREGTLYEDTLDNDWVLLVRLLVQKGVIPEGMVVIEVFW